MTTVSDAKNRGSGVGLRRDGPRDLGLLALEHDLAQSEAPAAVVAQHQLVVVAPDRGDRAGLVDEEVVGPGSRQGAGRVDVDDRSEHRVPTAALLRLRLRDERLRRGPAVVAATHDME